jgi:hypothetical protein
VPIPDFADAYKTQRVLEAAMVCAEQGQTFLVDEVDQQEVLEAEAEG